MFSILSDRFPLADPSLPGQPSEAWEQPGFTSRFASSPMRRIRVPSYLLPSYLRWLAAASSPDVEVTPVRSSTRRGRAQQFFPGLDRSGPLAVSLFALSVLATFTAGSATAQSMPAKGKAASGEPTSGPVAAGTSEHSGERREESLLAEQVKSESSVRVEYDICFAEQDGEPLLCDLYLPVASSAARALEPAAVPSSPCSLSASPNGLAGSDGSPPVMVVVHGGGWSMGDKWMVTGYGRAFAEAGIAAVVINYRLAPAHPFPAQVDDLRTALLWTKQQAGEYGWDIDRLGLFGYSAGAHLCLMLGTLADEPMATQQKTSGWASDDPRWSDLPRPQLIVAGGSPCDFRAMPPDNSALGYFLGGTREELPEVYRMASPASHVSAGDVPTLFYHGSRDLIVPMQSSRELCQQQRQAGVASRFVEIAGHGHLISFQHPQARQATLRFLRSGLLRRDEGSGGSDADEPVLAE